MIFARTSVLAPALVLIGFPVPEAPADLQGRSLNRVAHFKLGESVNGAFGDEGDKPEPVAAPVRLPPVDDDVLHRAELPEVSFNVKFC